MPFTQDFIQIDQVKIHLLRFAEFNPADYLDQLTLEEQERFFSFSHPKRKMEFVATRILRHRIFGFEHIHYDEHGAPYINQEGFISISHASGIVGIALCAAYKVGLDLESVRPKAVELASKFLSEKERSYFNLEDPTEMTTVWSAKEVLYKLAGRKEIHFKTQLVLKKNQNGTFSGTILNPDHELYTEIHVLENKGTIVSFNSKACEKR